MLAKSGIVAILFKIINFALILAVFSYVIKKYLLPGLYDRIERYQVYIKNLISRRNESQQLYSKLVKRLHEQEAEIKNLEAKLEYWRSSCEQEQHDELICVRIIEKDIKKKRLVQQENLKKEIMANTVLPSALVQAKEELTNRFEPEISKDAKEYIEQLLSFMKSIS